MSTVLVSRQEAPLEFTEVSTRQGPGERQPVWQPCTPPAVAEAERWNDGSPGWSAWATHLTERPWPQKLALWSAKRSPLLWGLGTNRRAEGNSLTETVELIALLHARPSASRVEMIQGHLHAWLAENHRAVQADGAANLNGSTEHRGVPESRGATDVSESHPFGPGEAARLPFALECLAWCHALPRLAAQTTAECWWELLHGLVDIAIAATDLAGPPGAGDKSWLQLLTVELPLTLAWLFPELETCHRLTTGARREFNGLLTAALDPLGLPRSDYLADLPTLLASWARTVMIARNLSECQGVANDQRFAAAVRTALRLTRRDGDLARPVAGQPQVTSADGLVGQPESLADALKAAVQVVGDSQLASLAADVLGQPSLRPRNTPDQLKVANKRNVSNRLDAGKNDTAKRARPSQGKPKPVKHSPSQSDAAKSPQSSILAGASSTNSEIAVLRCDWRRGSPLLCVDYQGSMPSIELSVGRDVLLRGPLETTIQLDGQSLPLGGRWENICWESDEKVDFLELERELPGGVHVQRQFLLAREARLLVIADAVVAREAKSNGETARTDVPSQPNSPLAEREGYLTGSRGSRWEYGLRLPLAEGATFEPAAETREGAIRTSNTKTTAANVLPLALGEWKADGRPIGLLARESCVEYRLTAQGRGFYAPLVIDLDTPRLRQPLTWRRLTVAEARQIMPGDVAAGFRVQFGREQFVLYRSLTGAANRTLLGLNVYCEFMLGRFQRNGECQQILEIEPE